MSDQFREKKKVSVVGIVGVPACYGGFESLVQNLVDYQSDSISYHIYCSAKNYKKKPIKYKDASLTYIPLQANGISSIIYDVYCLILAIFKRSDFVLILGVSGCLFLPLFRFFSRAKVITNIDGLEWRREKWGKWTKRFLKLSEKIAVAYSDTIIADNAAIAEYIKKEYSIESEVIAYGGDHALTMPLINTHNANGDYYFCVCRIEPENNIKMILEAFHESKEKIIIVGNWNSSSYGRSLKHSFTNSPNIQLLDPIYDINELFKLRSRCLGYVHGHSAGGTNPSLVEAMHFQTPVFAFDCDFNRYSTENKAFYFSSSKQLKDLLDSHTNDQVIRQRAQCAQNMKEIAMRRYTWKNIARMYEKLYQ